MAAVGAVLVLAGCTPFADDASDTPGASPTNSADPATGPRSGEPMLLGQVTVWPSAGTRVGAAEGGAVHLEVALGPGSSATPIPVLATEEGVEIEVLGDGSAVLRDATGVAGGVASPAVTRADGEPASALQVGEHGVLTLVPSAPPADATVALWLAGRAVDSLDWAERADEGGRSLAVVPTAWPRQAGSAGGEGVWAVVAALLEEASRNQ
ncbi:hypothetical protein, partial [Actinotalea sp. C106]|uniref:hypothetical protein n=1 Tax=Actinotalea sp. C106 TaxID=2908644 RepID=UPI0020295AC7